MYEKYTHSVKRALLLAFSTAALADSSSVENSHLLSALVKAPKPGFDIYMPCITTQGHICRNLATTTKNNIVFAFRRGSTLAQYRRLSKQEVSGWSAETQLVITGARTVSENFEHLPIIGTGHFLHSFLQFTDSHVAKTLEFFGITQASIREKIDWEVALSRSVPYTNHKRLDYD